MLCFTTFHQILVDLHKVFVSGEVGVRLHFPVLEFQDRTGLCSILQKAAG